MPEPIAGGRRYIAGLDGLRALAVLAVLAFHLGFGWASGGLLGVGVFFTLSGYLITDLLLAQYDAAGNLGLREFWWRRARRLLPALLVMLATVLAWVTVWQRSQLSALRGATAASLAYVSNWWLIQQHVSYFARFGPPSPLGHLWSLAVEEQFYLVWPWVLMLALCLGRRRPVRRSWLAGATLGLAAVSALLMAGLYHPGLDTTRIYDGTDTRAFGLLIGAALAMVWPSRRSRPALRMRQRLLLDAAGATALAGIVVMIYRTNQYSPFLYTGGLVLLSAATAVVVAAVVNPASWLAMLLGVRPLRWIGVRSYGIYLWHFPIIVLTTSVTSTAMDPLRISLQVAAIFAVAAVSWRYVEDPIRHGALGRLWALLRQRRLRSRLRGWRLTAVVAGVAVLITACVGMSTAPPTSASKIADAPASIDLTTTPTTLGPTPGPSRAPTHSPSSPPASSVPASSVPAPVKSAPNRPAPPPARPAAQATTTSCAGVTHIGDSTSEGMVSADYLPDPNQRLAAQYARVGVRTSHIEISGGTSIVETADPHQPNAYDVAQQLVGDGFLGCWVLALGTNDTADVYVGSVENQAQRIQQMMSLIGAHPVMWITVKSLLASGPYAEANMQRWNTALLQACAKYPNMRVYDWASVVQPSWFISDGIHYTSAGYAARADGIASALAQAFPATRAQPSTRCLVG